jgi:hypothetical protein
MVGMTKGRLTRQELGWLLTQEAQGAAERLRKGVQVLRTQVEAPAADPTVDDSLEALEGAVRVLSNMHQKVAPTPSRRGRIDVAALLWELSPDARVQIEPGTGTEVYGDESELRRMLHVLVDHGGGAGASVSVRGDGDEVRIAMTLGPDTSSTAETERQWLSRMAVRYGGRVELEGGHEVLTLRADDASERAERERLTRELEEARKQGAVVARELAQVLEHNESPDSILPAMAPSAEGGGAWARLAGGVAAELRALLGPLTRDLTALREVAGEERTEPLRRRLSACHDLAATLAVASEASTSELSSTFDLVEQVNHALAVLEGRAERCGVKVELSGSPSESVRALPKASQLLVRELIAQAIDATPAGASVTVSVDAVPGGVRLTVSDAGASLPAAMRGPFVRLEVEPGTCGRASALPLHVCAEVAQIIGIAMEFGDAPSGLRVSARFSR